LWQKSVSGDFDEVVDMLEDIHRLRLNKPFMHAVKPYFDEVANSKRA